MNIMDIVYGIWGFGLVIVGPILILVATFFSLNRLIRCKGQHYPKKNDDILLVVTTAIILAFIILISVVLIWAFTQNFSFM